MDTEKRRSRLAGHFQILSVASLILLLTGALTPVAAGDESNAVTDANEDDGASVASGYLRALVANNKNIAGYDVIIRSSQFSVVDGKVSSSRMARREIMDRRGENFLCVQSLISRETSEHDNEESKSNRGFDGVAFVEGGEWAKIGISGATRGKDGQKNFLLSAFAWNDFQLVGLETFPCFYRFRGKDLMANWIRIYSDESALKSSFGKNREDVAVQATVPIERKTSYDMVWSWGFDAGRFVPLSRAVKIFPEDPERKPYYTHRAQFKWEEKNGVMVPLEIHRAALKRRSIAGTNEIDSYEVLYDTEFEWLKVNEVIQPEETSIERLLKVNGDEFLHTEK